MSVSASGLIERVCRWIVVKSGCQTYRPYEPPNTFDQRLSEIEKVLPYLRSVESLSADWAARLKAAHKTIEATLMDRLERFEAASEVGQLILRMDHMQRVLMSNAALHAREQTETKTIINELNRRMWTFLGPGMPPSDGVVDSFRKTCTEMGADLAKLDNNQLRGCLREIVKAMSTLDAENHWNG